MGKRPQSTLHLQIGQETIYLLLTGSLFACFIMLTILLSSFDTFEYTDKPPPILRLEEANGYSFPSGSAAISHDFSQLLKTNVLRKLRTQAYRYNADVIEIVGHTDEVILKHCHSNLDKVLLTYLHGDINIGLTACDNVGLGMARAVAVARVLEETGLGKEFEIIPLSAGQLILPGDRLSRGNAVHNDSDRRRIEIRLRQRP